MHLSLLTYWTVDSLRVGAMTTSLSFPELNTEVRLVNTSKWRMTVILRMSKALAFAWSLASLTTWEPSRQAWPTHYARLHASLWKLVGLVCYHATARTTVLLLSRQLFFSLQMWQILYSSVNTCWEILLCSPTCGASQVGPVVKKKIKTTCQDRRPTRHGLDFWVRKTPRGGHGNPLQYSCLENRRDGGAWWTQLNRLSTQACTYLGDSKTDMVFCWYSGGLIHGFVEGRKFTCKSIKPKWG